MKALLQDEAPTQAMTPALRLEIPVEGLLERVGLVLNSTLELWEVLRSLAQVVLESTEAYRCSVFLLDDDTILKPATAIGISPDEDLWSAFRAMGQIDVSQIDHGWELVNQGRAVPITDAGASPLIPAEWVEAFSLRSIVLVPLHVAGDPCGLMAVDFQVNRLFSDEELRFYEAIASYGGVAVRNARLYETTKRRSELQKSLARASAALVSPVSREEFADRLVDGYVEILKASLCALVLVGESNTVIDTIASRGTRYLPRRLAVADIPAHLVRDLQTQWDGGSVMTFDDDPWMADVVAPEDSDVRSYVLFPLSGDRGLLGGIVLGFEVGHRLDKDEISAARALADIGTAALERDLLLAELERQLHHTRILHDLGEALAEKANAAALVARLNRLVEGQGIEITGLTFRDRSLARKLGGDEPAPEERRAWRSSQAYIELPSGEHSVPMRLGRRLVGALRIRTHTFDASNQAFLQALAHGVGQVASRGALRAEVEEAERERAVATERGRIAADLHDTAGQIFVAINLLARSEAEQLAPESPWAPRLLRLGELAELGKWEITRAVQALAFFPSARRGLGAALKSFARTFETDSGIDVIVEIQGRPVRLSNRIEQALYRVAHEALVNVWRHARCQSVRVLLDYGSEDVRLVVADDGIGVLARPPEGATRVGISSMRKAMSDIGGTLSIRTLRPRGARVEALVPKVVR